MPVGGGRCSAGMRWRRVVGVLTFLPNTNRHPSRPVVQRCRQVVQRCGAKVRGNVRRWRAVGGGAVEGARHGKQRQR